MEKNIHDDRLDDYIKKSFDDYEENPSPDMWDRVEGGMPAAKVKPPVRYFFSAYRWQLAAATVILLLISRLVCVQFYYEDKLRTISEQQLKALPTDGGNAPEPLSIIETTTSKPAEPTGLPGEMTHNYSAESSHIAADIEAKRSNKVAHKPANASNNTRNNRIPLVAASPGKKMQTQVSPITEQPVPNNIASLEPATPALVRVPKIAEFQTLTFKTPLLSFDRTAQPSMVDVPIKKFKSASGWYAGISITPHLIVEKTVTPHRTMPNPRRLFANKQERPQVSANVAVRLGKKISSRFALESGLGFQSLTRKATHLARFEYRDGHTIQNPGGQDSRSFDYDLNTYGGSASVSLRTELSGSDIPGADEQVRALITSKESIQLLQIPFLGVGRFGHGRTQAVIKAGLVGNYFVKNQIALSAFAFENHKLRLRHSDGFSVEYKRPQHFILGYQLAAGLEFRLNKNLNLAVVPTFTGDFKRNDPQLGKLPGHSSFGVSMGANWWF